MNFLAKNWKKILPCLGTLLLFYLFWHFDIKEIYRAFSGVDLRYLPLFPVIMALVFFIQTWKWKLIINAQNINKIALPRLIKIQLIGLYYSLLTPGRAGIFLKAPYLKDETGKSIEECSSGIFIDKVLDLLALLIFSGIGAFLLVSPFPSLLPRIILALTIICFLLFVFYSPKRAKPLLKCLFYVFIPVKFKVKFKNSFHLFYREMPAFQKLISPFLLTALCWLLVFSQTFIIAKSLSININYFVFIFISALATAVGLLPLTISGLGTKETAFIVLFKNFNIVPQKLIVMSLLSTAMAFVLLFLVAIIFAKEVFKKS